VLATAVPACLFISPPGKKSKWYKTLKSPQEARMYTPKAFEVTDLPLLHAAMKQSELATLVTITTNGLVATHLPLLLDETRGEYGTLTGHVSRANVQWRETDANAEALIIFLGLDSYVSPNWYPAKQETGRVVPTWNYAAIHAYGRITFIEDPEWLRAMVSDLTKKHEASFPAPWQVTDAPAVYIDSQLKAIVGFEFQIVRLEGKQKFNQNRSVEDRLGVIEGLRELEDGRKTQVAELMEGIESRLKPL
jgi:transcriptional regulator